MEGLASAGASPVHVAAPSTGLTAVPVHLRLRGANADAIRRWVEGVLGWQPVDSASDPLLPPALVLVDEPFAEGRAPVVREADELPRILVVDDGADPGVTGERVLRAAPDAVVSWPSGRERLATIAAGVLAGRKERTAGVRTLRIGGAAGGVGTTTVALAVGGLWAWRGSRTLAVVRGGWPDLPFVDAAALRSPDAWGRAVPASGVPELRMLRLTRSSPRASSAGADALVLDEGAALDVDVLVCRPDAAALPAVDRTTAGLLVVVGEGPVSPSAFRRAAAGRRVLPLPTSARIARAALQGRVPASIPGAWLRRLAAGLGAGSARPGAGGKPQ